MSMQTLPTLSKDLLIILNHVHISEPYLEPAPSDFLEFKKLYNLLNKLGYKKALSIEMKSKNIDIRTIKKCLSTIAKINH